MATGGAVAGAAAFTWLGMVLAISFLEAPLKFRAPEVSVRIGLGIGRLVFRALNAVEAVLAVVVVAAGAVTGRPAVLAAASVAALLLVVQVAAVRPPLNRRTERVLAGHDAPRSRAHLAYVAVELVKVVALVLLGVAALAG